MIPFTTGGSAHGIIAAAVKNGVITVFLFSIRAVMREKVIDITMTPAAMKSEFKRAW